MKKTISKTEQINNQLINNAYVKNLDCFINNLVADESTEGLIFNIISYADVEAFTKGFVEIQDDRLLKSMLNSLTDEQKEACIKDFDASDDDYRIVKLENNAYRCFLTIKRNEDKKIGLVLKEDDYDVFDDKKAKVEDLDIIDKCIKKIKEQNKQIEEAYQLNDVGLIAKRKEDYRCVGNPPIFRKIKLGKAVYLARKSKNHLDFDAEVSGFDFSARLFKEKE